jgi:patatin-like phospholipase/acyl hydrolase
MSNLIKVLSIDGGGIRGIIPAMVLAEIERRTGKRIWGLFDLVAGTSTGGILALGITKPSPSGGPEYTAEDAIQLYERQGERIFWRPVWRRVPLLSWLLEEKYPSSGIEDVLAEYFGEARLSDALTEVLITSYDIERSKPYFFKRNKAREKVNRDCPMRWAARATSAAPTYFQPAKLPVEGSSDYRALIDGGVFANNPAMCALVEGRSNPKLDAELLLVSLGTGELTRRLPYDEVKDWGLARWAQPVLDLVFDGVSDAVDYQLRQLLSVTPGHERYYRFQVKLDEGNDAMDDASPGNIRVLKLLAEDMITQNDNLLTSLCNQLVA